MVLGGGGGDKQGTFARFARFARFFQRKGVERSPKIFFFPRQKKKKKSARPARGFGSQNGAQTLQPLQTTCGSAGGAPPLHAHARLRARRARRTGTGHRRDPWQSPLHPGSPREARSALAFEMRWLISLPSPETCGISARRGGARGAAGPPRAAGGSAAVSVGSLGPHVVAWVLAEGR